MYTNSVVPSVDKLVLIPELGHGRLTPTPAIELCHGQHSICFELLPLKSVFQSYLIFHEYYANDLTLSGLIL